MPSYQKLTLEELLKLKTDIIGGKTDQLFKDLNQISASSLDSIKEYLADFEYVNGKYINNKVNQDKILGLKKYLITALKNDFNISITDYQTQFNVIAEVNISIQKISNINYEPSEFLRTFVNKTVLESMTLTKAIDNSALTGNIQRALSRYVTGEYSRGAAVKNITQVVTQDTGLARWARVISNDALRIYDGKIQQEIKADSGVNGSFYLGTLIETSRPVCRYCVGQMNKNGFIWFDEVPHIVDTYKDSSGYDENMPLTESTFLEVCGGHACRHNQTVGYKKRK